MSTMRGAARRRESHFSRPDPPSKPTFASAATAATAAGDPPFWIRLFGVAFWPRVEGGGRWWVLGRSSTGTYTALCACSKDMIKNVRSRKM